MRPARKKLVVAFSHHNPDFEIFFPALPFIFWTTMNQAQPQLLLLSPQPFLFALSLLLFSSHFAVTAAAAAATASATSSPKPEIATRQLPNGIEAVVVRFPQSTNVSIYAFSPMSLATDAPHQAQWAHLVE